MKYEKLLDIPIALGTRCELLALARSMLGSGGRIATVNPEMLSLSRRCPELRSALLSSVNVPDGVGVRHALVRRGLRCEVLPGVELGELLLERGVRFAIIGGKGNRAVLAAKRLEAAHKGAECVLALSGYGHTDGYYIRELSACRPSLVFVCLGTPKQELFISRAREKYREALYIGLGGSVDIYSGRVRRAPLPLRRLGLEWLFRVLRHPRRIPRAARSLSFFYYCERERFLHKFSQNR